MTRGASLVGIAALLGLVAIADAATTSNTVDTTGGPSTGWLFDHLLRSDVYSTADAGLRVNDRLDVVGTIVGTTIKSWAGYKGGDGGVAEFPMGIDTVGNVRAWGNFGNGDGGRAEFANGVRARGDVTAWGAFKGGDGGPAEMPSGANIGKASIAAAGNVTTWGSYGNADGGKAELPTGAHIGNSTIDSSGNLRTWGNIGNADGGRAEFAAGATVRGTGLKVEALTSFDGGPVNANVQLLDGLDSTAFCAVSGDTMTGQLVFSGVATDIGSGTNEDITIASNGDGGVRVFSPSTVVSGESGIDWDDHGGFVVRSPTGTLRMAGSIGFVDSSNVNWANGGINVYANMAIAAAGSPGTGLFDVSTFGSGSFPTHNTFPYNIHYNHITASPGSDQNDYTGCYFHTYCELNPSVANVNITGIEDNASLANYDGFYRHICNINASNTITLNNENASSKAGSRFTLPGGSDVVIAAKSCVSIVYSSTLSRWLQVL